MAATSRPSLAEAVVHALVEQIADPPTTVPSLVALADQVARRLGFSEVSCWRVSHYGQPSDPTLIFGKASPEWRDHYLAEGFLHADPAVLLISRCRLPFTWSEAEKLRQDDLTQKLFDDRRAKRSRDAVICPVFGPCGERDCVAFLSGDLLTLDDTTRAYLSRIADILVSMFWDITREYELPTDLAPTLSGRESECLFWLSQGKSTGDTGAILGLSPHTVRGYIQSAMVKLDARNRDELILRAMPLGLLMSYR